MSALQLEIKNLIIEALGLEDIGPQDIGDEQTLFGEGLGLDSVDAWNWAWPSRNASASRSTPKPRTPANTLPTWPASRPSCRHRKPPEGAAMQNRDEIFATLRDALVELFELEPERVTLEANLYEDLEIDSIDAVDLIDHIKRQTGRKIAAEEFKAVRTVGDVVEAVHRLVNPAE